MNDHGQSDGLVVPAKLPNNAAGAAAEVVEERRPAEGNTASETRPGRRAGVSVNSDLDRVRQAAVKDKQARFTALLHHVTVDRLRAAYRSIRPEAAPGVGRPETFQFLGFTHLCAKTQAGQFRVRRVTIKKRMSTKLRELKFEMRRRAHLPIPVQGRWLASVLTGHYRYFAVPGNINALGAFRNAVIRLWMRTLRRRSQRHRMTWERMARITQRWLPTASILHPWPNQRFDARTQGRSPVR